MEKIIPLVIRKYDEKSKSWIPHYKHNLKLGSTFSIKENDVWKKYEVIEMVSKNEIIVKVTEDYDVSKN